MDGTLGQVLAQVEERVASKAVERSGMSTSDVTKGISRRQDPIIPSDEELDTFARRLRS